MGEHTDKISGRVKQAVGVLTGDRDLKREGASQEHKGEVKGRIDDAVDKAQAGPARSKSTRSYGPDPQATAAAPVTAGPQPGRSGSPERLGSPPEPKASSVLAILGTRTDMSNHTGHGFASPSPPSGE